MEPAIQIREKRFHPRVPCGVEDSQGQIVRNIGQGGLYLETRKKHYRKSNLLLSFLLPPGDVPMKLEATVIRSESLGSNRFGYGLRYKDIGADEFKQIQYFALYQATKEEKPQPAIKGEQKVFYKTITVSTKQQNLSTLDPRLGTFLRPTDYFYVHDLTKDFQVFAQATGISHGTMTAQILHTSATLCVNELDEPMLLMDLVKKFRDIVPKDADYFHNSPLREANICPEDSHCDRNGDAHVRAVLFGHHSVTVLIRDGRLILGQWQKVALLEFDGPRRREVLVQVVGV